MSPFKQLAGKKILIGVSGSIAAFKVAQLVSDLKKLNADVRVVMSKSALQFLGKATFEGLTGTPVLDSDFTDGKMMSHISLAKWADVFLIAPATAQTINSLASGIGGGILLSTYLAYDLNKPLLIAPAMNTQMLAHPTTQTSLEILAEYGIQVLNTGSGDLACGDVGEGRLLEPEEILAAIQETISSRANSSTAKSESPKRKNKDGIKPTILITAGGTKVPIDSVRSLTNTSTGRTGSLLADYFSSRGYSVDLLLAKDGVPPQNNINVFPFETYDEFATLLEHTLKNKKYDFVIQAAAVSDFKVAPVTGKLRSGATKSLELIPTVKLISQIKKWNKTAKIIGFKLTDNKDVSVQAEAIQKVFKQAADWVVHNDMSRIWKNSHMFSLYNGKKKLGDAAQKEELGPLLEKFVIAPTKISGKTQKFAQEELQ